MLKLHNIFLRKFLLIFLGLFLMLGIVFYVTIKEVYVEQTKIDLLHNIEIFSANLDGIENIDQRVKELNKLVGLRITIIDQEGVVIAESDKDKSLLENHLGRVEIIQARSNHYGYSIRYSQTLQKDLLYVAKEIKLNNKEYYVRIARDLEKINSDFLTMGLKVGAVFFVFISFAFLVTLKISTNLQEEINRILEFLENLARQKRAEIITSNYSFELYSITQLLTKVSESLSKKDKQKSKYTAKLKLSNKQKDDIISAISHEFKNPIAVISGYTQTLLADKDINEKIREKFLQKIASSSKKMTNMIDRLRLTIRLDDGKMENKLHLANIREIVQMQVEDIMASYPNRDIVFEGKDVIKKVDETLLGVAVINLIENALKYSQDKVTIKLYENKISIQDHGIGINEKEIDKITKKFYRVSTNGWNNSLGVGLSLVSNIVALHNFTLHIESIENEGSTFEILFSAPKEEE